MRKNVNSKYLLILLGIILCAASIVNAQVKVAPYYSLELTEGGVLTNKGSMLSLNLINDIGLIFKPQGKHTFVAFYELKYTGPGLQRQEGKEFTDSSMDHIVIVRHHYDLSDLYKIKSQINYMNEYSRIGTNETMGGGTYDFTRYGLSVTGIRQINKKISAEASVSYNYLNFPNYEDLLATYRLGGEASESVTGKQNHKLYQFGGAVRYESSKATLGYTIMSYDKQNVVTETAQADGSFYSSTLQKDTVLAIGANHTQKIFNFIKIAPSVSYRIKNSNQNYQHFETPTSTVPVRYFGDYYDYSQYIITIPTYFLLASKWETYCSLEYDFKNYSKRPARLGDDEFSSSLNYVNIRMLSGGITFKPNPITRTTLFYSNQTQASNTKYELNVPYNYDAHYIGINFKYSF